MNQLVNGKADQGWTCLANGAYGSGNETLHESASFLEISRRTSSVCFAAQPGLPPGSVHTATRLAQLRPPKVNVVPRLLDPDGGAGIGSWSCLLGPTHDWHANYKCHCLVTKHGYTSAGLRFFENCKMQVTRCATRKQKNVIWINFCALL